MAKNGLRNRVGDNQKAHNNEEDWNEKGLAEEIQFLLRRVVADSGIDRQSGHKRPDNVWQINEIGELAGHRHDAKHRDKIGLLTIVQLVQNPGAGTAYAYQDQRHKDGDLGNLQRETGWRKAGRVDGNANPEYDQRQRIRYQSRANRDDDRLQSEGTKALRARCAKPTASR